MHSKRTCRLPLIVPFIMIVLLGMVISTKAEGQHEAVLNVQEYFPDRPGNEWHYRGQVVEGGVAQISEKQFSNVSTVMDEKAIEGVMVTVFHDTNPGDQGASDSYYRRDIAGIRYYGSKPGTALEKQLVPYQIVRFPLEIPSAFQQLDRKGLDLGMDLDFDGQNEQVDVRARVSVIGKETVSVPLGTYSDAIRLEAQMTMDVHLSKNGMLVHGNDTMTVWFGRGVGLLKYVERQSIPNVRSQNGRVIEITEELEKVTIQEDSASLGGGKSTAKRIFTNNSFYHELP